eukprot:PhF_6_TR38576/c1_g1_i1/m.57283
MFFLRRYGSMLLLVVALYCASSLTCVTAQSISVAVAQNQLTLTENTVRQGGNVMTMVITGATWDTLTTTNRADLQNGYWPRSQIGNIHYLNGFRARKSLLIQSSSFSLADSNTLLVTWVADSVYDISRTENVTVRFPRSAVTGAQQITNTLTIIINPSTGTLSMTTYTFTENDIRSGGQLITVTLSAQETWIDAKSIIRYITGTSNDDFRWNYCRTRNLTIPQANAAISGQNVVFTLGVASVYDTPIDEVITIDVPARAVRSFLKPNSVVSSLTFTIKATAGTFSIPNPTVYGETRFIRSFGSQSPTLVITLDTGETWKTTTNVNVFYAALVSNRNEATGFNARKSVILPVANIIVSATKLTYKFTTDASFDITLDEVITFSPTADMTSSGLLPSRKSGTSYTDSFVIQVERGIVMWDYVQNTRFTESYVRTGGSTITISLERGETWASGNEAAIRAALVATTSQTNGWNTYKTSMISLTSSPSGVRLLNGNRDLVLTFTATSAYDISVTETVVFAISNAFTTSAKIPYNASVSFQITPFAGEITMTHATKTNPMTFTENEVRAGIGKLSLTWTSGETWSGSAFSPLNITASSTRSEPWGYTRRIRSRLYLLPTNMITYENSFRTMALTLSPDAGYDIAGTETWSINIRAAAIASRRLPSPLVSPNIYFQITVTPTAGTVTLVCCLTYTEQDFQRGRAQLKLRLSPGETWQSGAEAGIRSSFATNRVDEPSAWQQRSLNVFKTNGVVISNVSRDMTINFAQDPQFDLEKYTEEVITITFTIPPFPSGAVRSGLQLSPTSLAFTIFRQRGLINMTTATTYTEKDIRRGGSLIRIWLALWETWETGIQTAIQNAWSADSGDAAVFTTGFNALRSTLMPLSAIYVPPTKSSGALRIVLAPSASYDIQKTEVWTLALTSSMVKGKVVPNPSTVTITIQPSPGEIVMTPTITDEGTMRSKGIVITFTLSAWETWNTNSFPAADFINNIVSTSSTDFVTMRTAFLPSVNSVQITGQVMKITFNPVSTYDISKMENLTFVFPLSAVSSDRRPVAISGRLRLTIKTNPGEMFTIPSSVSFNDNQIRTQTNSFQVKLGTEKWTLTTGCITRLLEGNFTTNSPTLANGFKARMDAKTLLTSSSFSVNSASDTLTVTFNMDTLFDETGEEIIKMYPPRVCYLSQTVPRIPFIRFRLTVYPGILSVSPTSFTETQVRLGTARVTLTITNGEGWGPSAFEIVKGITTDKTAISEPFGITGRRNILFNRTKFYAPTSCSAPYTSIVFRLWDTLFDLTSQETVSINSDTTGLGKCACVCAQISPFLGSTPLTFSVTPVAGTVTLGTKSPYKEYDVRAGYIKFNITLARGETWVNTVSARQAIIDGISSNLLVGFGGSAYSFNGLKDRGPKGQSLLIPNAKYMKLITPWVLQVTLNASTVYDIDADETITVVVPGTAVKSGIAPTSVPSTLSFTIRNEVGTSLIISPSTITEASIRAGSAVVTMTLFRSPTYRPLNDTWTNAAMEMVQSMLTASTTFDKGFNAREKFLLPRSSVSLQTSRRVMVLKFAPDSGYDTATTETITVAVPKIATLLRSIPRGIPKFFITPSPGVVTLKPNVLRETQIRAGTAVFNISLALGETYVATSLTSSLTSTFFSNKNEPTGFNVLSSKLLTTSSLRLANSQAIYVTFQPVTEYDVSQDETISITLPASLFASGLTPTPTTLTFKIIATRVTVTMSPYPLTISESTIRTGGTQVTFTLDVGETWKQNYADFVAGMTSPVTMSGFTGWNHRKGAILPTFNFKIVTPQQLVFTLAPDTLYDAKVMEKISIQIPSSMVASGLVPFTRQKLFFNITVVPGSVAMKNPNQIITEQHVRTGVATITLVLTDDEFVITDFANLFGGFVSSSSILSEPSGWNARRSTLLATSSFTLVNSNRELRVAIQTDTNYDIMADELIRVDVPPTVTANKRSPIGAPLFFKILRTYVVMNRTQFTESDLQKGSRLLVYLYYDLWATSKQTVVANSFIVPSSPLNTGFQRWKNTIIQATTMYFSNTILVIPLNPAPQLRLCALYEDITLNLPNEVFLSGKSPQQLLTFRVSGKAYPILFSHSKTRSQGASASTFTITEDDLRRSSVTINVTVQQGTWAVPGEQMRDAFFGSRNDTTGFTQRRLVLLPSGSVVRYGQIVAFTIRPDPVYNIGGNEVVTLRVLNTYTQCAVATDQFGTNFSFTVIGKPSSVDSMSIQPQQTEYASGSIITFFFTGFELNAFRDTVGLVDADVYSSCDAAPRTAFINLTIGSMNGNSTRDALVTSTNWSVQVWVTGRYQVCYMPSTSTSFTTFRSQGQLVAIVGKIYFMAPLRRSWALTGTPQIFAFSGFALSSLPAGDSIKLITPLSETCESSTAVAITDLNGNREFIAGSILQNYTIYAPGVYAWCYQLRASFRWKQLAVFNISGEISLISTSWTEPNASFPFTVYGRGFDTRPNLATSTSIAIVPAQLTKTGNCTDTRRHLFVTRDLGPNDVAGTYMGSMTVTPLAVGFYTICIRTHALRRWEPLRRSLRNFRVRSAAVSFTPKTIFGSSLQTVNVTGEGIAFPDFARLYVRLVPLGTLCSDSITNNPLNTYTRGPLQPKIAYGRVNVAQSVWYIRSPGQYTVCWTTPERNFFYTSFPQSSTLTVYPIFSSFSPSTIGSGVFTFLTVRGASINPKDSTVVFITTSSTCNPTQSVFSGGFAELDVPLTVVTSSNNFKIDPAGIYYVCVTTLSRTFQVPGVLNVTASFSNITAGGAGILTLEQYDAYTAVINGTGLDTRDSLRRVSLSIPNASCTNPSAAFSEINVLSFTSQTSGLTSVRSVIDTKIPDFIALCYKAYSAPTYVAIATLAIRAYARVTGFFWTTDSATSRITFNMLGTGLDSRDINGDVLQAVEYTGTVPKTTGPSSDTATTRSYSTACTDSTKAVLFRSTTLGPFDDGNTTNTSVTWLNSFALLPSMTMIVCYKHSVLATNSYVALGYITVPFASPSFKWVGYNDIVQFVSSTYNQVRISDINFGGNGNVAQMTFVVDVYFSGVKLFNVTDSFEVQPSILVVGNTGNLTFKGRVGKEGMYTFVIRGRSIGAGSLATLETSDVVQMDVYQLANFGLAVSPTTGGQAFTTIFTISVSGGLSYINQRDMWVAYYLVPGQTIDDTTKWFNLKANSQVFSFQTTELPAGTHTIVGVVTSSNNTAIRVLITALVIVSGPGTAVSLASVTNGALAKATTDPAGALYTAGSAALTLNTLGSTTDKQSLKESLSSVINTAVNRFSSTGQGMTDDQVYTAVNALRQITNNEVVSVLTLTSATTAQQTILANLKNTSQSTAQALLDLSSNLVLSVPTYYKDPGLGDTAALKERADISSAAVAVALGAHKSMYADCSRQLSSVRSSASDGSVSSQTFTSFTTQSMVINSVALSRASSTTLMALSTGQVVSYSIGRPSYDACRASCVFPSRNMFPVTGSPTTTPRLPILTFSLPALTSGTSGSTDINLLIPMPSDATSSDTFTMLYYSPVFGTWSVMPSTVASVNGVSVQVKISWSFSQAVRMHREVLQASSSESGSMLIAGLRVQPLLELNPCFPCWFLPVMVGLYFVLVVPCGVIEKLGIKPPPPVQQQAKASPSPPALPQAQSSPPPQNPNQDLSGVWIHPNSMGGALSTNNNTNTSNMITGLYTSSPQPMTASGNVGAMSPIRDMHQLGGVNNNNNNMVAAVKTAGIFTRLFGGNKQAKLRSSMATPPTVLTPQQITEVINADVQEGPCKFYFRYHMWFGCLSLLYIPHTNFKRFQRGTVLVCFWYLLLAFVSLALDNTAVSWASDRTWSASTDIGKAIGLGVGLGLAATIIAWGLEWLFESYDLVSLYLRKGQTSTVGPPQSMTKAINASTSLVSRAPTLPATTTTTTSTIRDQQIGFTRYIPKRLLLLLPNKLQNRVIFPYLVFWSISIACYVIVFVRTKSYNVASQVEEFFITFAFGCAFSIVVWEIFHVILLGYWKRAGRKIRGVVALPGTASATVPTNAGASTLLRAPPPPLLTALHNNTNVSQSPAPLFSSMRPLDLEMQPVGPIHHSLYSTNNSSVSPSRMYPLDQPFLHHDPYPSSLAMGGGGGSGLYIPPSSFSSVYDTVPQQPLSPRTGGYYQRL